MTREELKAKLKSAWYKNQLKKAEIERLEELRADGMRITLIFITAFAGCVMLAAVWHPT